MAAADIRNLTFLGSSDAGKTSLLEALAHHYGATSRQGSVEEGNTLCDFTPEEKEKKHSLQAAVVHLEKGPVALNLVDTPGYPDFLADAYTSMAAAGGAVLTVAARTTGVPFHARRLWKAAKDRGLARAVVVTKVDGDNLDLEAILESLGSAFGTEAVPYVLPDGVGGGFSAVQPVLGGDSTHRSRMVDAIVEGDDALMEKYLEEGDVADEELRRAIPAAIAAGTFAPVFFVNPVTGTGVAEFAEFLLQEFPGADRLAEALRDEHVSGGGPSDPLVARVWKVLSDKHLGQISYLRVLQGTVQADAPLPNPRGGKPLKASGLSHIFGAELKPVAQAGPGEIVALTRVEELSVGDVLKAEGECAVFDFGLPEPVTPLAVRPESRSDEQKISGELAKLAKEDPTFRVERHEVTGETIVYGLSELHLQSLLNRLKGRGVGVTTSVPRIAYQETITTKAEGHHRHKKQTGGSGQFGECFIRIEPLPRGQGFEFVDAIVGGAIPRQYIPAVEKGIREQMEKGVLAGSQVVDIKVELYDGKHHEVDSDEISFKTAGARALVEAFSKGRPILLEPIMEVEITVPSRFMGDVTGDLNTRRGRILGMDAVDEFQVIKAQVPLAEMQTYSTPLRSMTAGEGSFTMRFDHYDQVPPHIQDKIIADYEKAKAEA